MAESRRMTPEDAITLQKMMMMERPSYLENFTAFRSHDTLHIQCINAKNDGFFVLSLNNCLAGFFCLRGLDEGYEKPSFGVYVASKYQGKGLARLALKEASNWCKRHSLPAIILKVTKNNKRAYCLYRRYGFIPTEYCDKREDISMEKEIN